MNLTTQTTATIAKSLSIKREKGATDEEAERVVAHLKFAGMFFTRVEEARKDAA